MGLVALGIVLITAVAGCGDSGGGIVTATPTATSAQVVKTPTPSSAPTATQVAATSTLRPTPTSPPAPTATQAAAAATSTPSPTPPPAPKVEVTISYRSSRESDTEQIMLYGTVTGVLTYEGGQAVPAGSQIRIRVRGPNDRYGAVGLSQSFEKSEQFPLSFCLPLRPLQGQ